MAVKQKKLVYNEKVLKKKKCEMEKGMEKIPKRMLLQSQFQPIVTKVHTLSFNRQNAVKKVVIDI